jgi:hypothetical protein
MTERTESTEAQRIAIAKMHALATSALKATKDLAALRKYLEVLGEMAPDPPAPDDPRSDHALVGDLLTDPAEQRRAGAQVRGVILGAAAHEDTVVREVVALVRSLDGLPKQTEKKWTPKIESAVSAVRRDLAIEMVAAFAVAPPSDGRASSWLRRWGGLRNLELNAFVAAFTRDSTHVGATVATSQGPDAAALRYLLVLSQYAFSFPSEDSEAAQALTWSSPIVLDAKRAETALASVLANLVREAQQHGEE